MSSELFFGHDTYARKLDQHAANDAGMRSDKLDGGFR